MGDCSTMEQRLLQQRLHELFKQADTDKTGLLSFAEFRTFMDAVISTYPQLEDYIRRLNKIFVQYDTNKDGHLSIDEFKNILLEADTNLKNLPATAQVASQQGIYLAKLLNDAGKGKLIESANGFRYNHIGYFAYIGERSSVGSIEGADVKGWGAWWLWRGIYVSKQVSFRNQFLILFDWIKSGIFGRDISRF